MPFIVKCSEFNPEEYRDKKLAWFSWEQEGHFKLHAYIATDHRTFILMAAAISGENQVKAMNKQIDTETLRKMTAPKSRYLKVICDYVIFENSPQAEAKFGIE